MIAPQIKNSDGIARIKSRRRPVWDMAPLGELCVINLGKTPPRSDMSAFAGDKLWVKISDMDGVDEIIRTGEMLTDEAVKKYKCRPIVQGTVLLSFKLTIGRVAVAGVPMFTNEAIAALPIRDSAKGRITPEYLFWALRSMQLGEHAPTAAKGKTLNKKILETIMVPIPPLAKQNQIVKFLSVKFGCAARIKAVMQMQAEAITALPESMLSRAFPRKPKMHLGDVCEIVREKPGNYAGEKPYYSTGAIATGERGECEMVSATNRPSRANVLPNRDDVGFAVMKNTAKAVLVDTHYEGAIFSTGFCFLRPSPKISPEFLFYWVSGGEFQRAKDRASADGIMSGLRLADTLDLEIPVPPLSEQCIIARMLTAKMKTAAKLNAIAQAQLDAIEALPGAWLRRAFSEQ